MVTVTMTEPMMNESKGLTTIDQEVFDMEMFTDHEFEKSSKRTMTVVEACFYCYIIGRLQLHHDGNDCHDTHQLQR
jgi:hypothetical protein